MHKTSNDGSLHLTQLGEKPRCWSLARRRSVFAVGALLLATIACAGSQQIGQKPRATNPPSSASTQLPSPVTKTIKPSNTPTSVFTATRASTPTPVPVSLSQGNADEIRPLYVLSGPTRGVTQVVISPDSEVVAASSLDGLVWVWRRSDGGLVNTLRGHSDGIQSLAVSPDGKLLASGSNDRTVKLWRVDDGSLVSTIGGSFLGRILRVVFSPDGSLFAMADDRCFVQIRRTNLGVLRQSLAQPNCLARLEGTVSAWGLTFSPDGAYLLAGESRPCCGGSLQRWEVDEHRSPTTLLDYDLRFHDVVYSPDGSLLALAFEGSPVFWVIHTDGGDPIHTFEGHSYQVNSLAFSPNGELLVSGSRDQKVRIWRIEDGVLLYTLEGHTDNVNSVAFSPDGSTIASGSDDGTVILWGLTRAHRP